MSGWRVAVVASGLPRRSETFALNELLALAEADRLAAVFATKPGDGAPPQPGWERLAPFVTTLPPGDAAAQARTVATALAGRPVAGVHGYFAHAPAAVAERAAAHLGIAFGFSCHARDARKVPARDLRRRTRRARVVIGCNPDVLAAFDAPPGRAHLVPHGVDLERFRPTPPDAARPLRLLAVGRFVAKKGFDVLVRALARTTRPVRLVLVGAGPEGATLVRLRDALGLGDRVTFAGPATHRDLPGRYAAAHAVVVPSVVDAAGDRDGLPNVVLEAMASGRAVVASRVSALPTAVRDGVTGLLVPPGDPVALAGALDRLAADPDLVIRFGAAGRAAARPWALAARTAVLLDRLGAAYA